MAETTEEKEINIIINGEPRTLNLEVEEPIELKEHDRIKKINGEWYLIKYKEVNNDRKGS